MIDDADVRLVNEMRWFVMPCIMKSGKRLMYVANKNTDTQVMTKLHRLLMNPSCAEIYVDHINGDPLDNRRNNLRLVTPHGNSMNIHGTLGYYRDTRLKKFRAQIRTFDKLIHIGLFPTEAEANAAYLEAKAKYHIITPYHT